MKIDWSRLFSYIFRCADQKTIEEVECWRREEPENEAFYQQAYRYYTEDPLHNENFSDEQLDVFYARLQHTQQLRRRRIRMRRLTAAASFLLLASAGGLWWHEQRAAFRSEPIEVVMKEAEEVGKIIVITENGAKLTAEEVNPELALQVAPNQLSYHVEDSVKSRKAEEKALTHTVVVPKGKTFELVLSDGTFVLLEPMSELTYPVRFDSTATREVRLRGEAYFDVTKSARRFVVHTERMKLQVYGTQFNVRAREEGDAETVLLSGKVGISALHTGGSGEVILQPGEKSYVNAAGQVAVEQTDVTEYIAKQNGYILFNGKTLEEIFQSIELYYDVDFVVKTSVRDTQKYVCSFKRGISLREALDVIEFISDVTFTITGREVQIQTE